MRSFERFYNDRTERRPAGAQNSKSCQVILAAMLLSLLVVSCAFCIRNREFQESVISESCKCCCNRLSKVELSIPVRPP
jgi:hypothetical protein